MLNRSHPKKRNVPTVQLTLSDLQELIDLFVANIGEKPRIDFKGTDGSNLWTTDILALNPDDGSIPDLILAPTITAAADSKTITFHTERIPNSGGGVAELYVLEVTAKDAVWSSGITNTLMDWLARKRTLLFRFYYHVVIALLILGAIGIVYTILASIKSGPNNTTILTPSRFAIPTLRPFQQFSSAFASGPYFRDGQS